MKNVYLVLLLICTAFSRASAGPGDTTVVNGHTNVVIQTNPSTGYTVYDTWSEFPTISTPYRRVLAYLTFECAPGLKCGEWDYGNHIYIKKVGGVNAPEVNYELGRFITPYGFYWSSADNWKHGWWLDVTDWAPLLRDSVLIQYQHSGYEANNDRGWLINLKYYVIEGTPVRTPLAITPMWNKSIEYGNPAKPVTDSLAPISITLGANTHSAKLWVMQSGHGSDQPDGCGEFCDKWRSVLMDGNTVHSRSVWRKCGFNSLYPQAGTWLLDRANWCPGATVLPDNIELGNNLTPGSTHSIDIEMEPYTATSNFGNFNYRTYLFEYGAINAQNDVTLDAIIAPSTEYEAGRYNPVCGQPIIVIRNSGALPLTSASISYGLEGEAAATYQWSGHLEFMESDTVTLPQLTWNIAAATQFLVSVNNPNGTTDGFIEDNAAHSTVLPVPVHDAGFIVLFQNTKAIKETGYKFINAATGQVVYERAASSFSTKAIHRDTVALDTNTCYIFELNDEGAPLSGGVDINADGLNFWYWDVLAQNYPQYLQYIDNEDGVFRFLNPSNSAIVKDFTANKTTSIATIRGGDFGTKIIYQFRTNNTIPVGLKDVHTLKGKVEVYPNPSTTGTFKLTYDLLEGVNAMITITDILGRSVYTETVKGKVGSIDLDLSHMAKGSYFLKFTSGVQSLTKKLTIN